MQRDPTSHKGDNGRVAIIGGSRHIHGAPLLSALAAQASGVDLLYLYVPSVHEEVAKNTSLNFQVRTFAKDEIGKADIEPILELLASMDVAVIGPGLARDRESLKTIGEICASATCKLALDASALQKDTLKWVEDKDAVLTPHLGELERMDIAPEDIASVAKEYGVTILLKGPNDIVAGPEGVSHESVGGNAGLTVGGTGDALAGLTAGFIAQRVEPPEAAWVASMVIKKAGDALAEQQGFTYTARDVIDVIPLVLKEMSK